MQRAQVLVVQFGDGACRQALYQAPGVADTATQLQAQALRCGLGLYGQMKRQDFAVATQVNLAKQRTRATAHVHTEEGQVDIGARRDAEQLAT
jgi:hypothetical protein